MPATTAPDGLHDAGVAADPATGGAVAFGGVHDSDDGRRVPSAATRAWTGAAWSTVVVPTGPPARHNPVLVCDHNAGRTLLFGGTTTSPSPSPRGPSQPAPVPGRAGVLSVSQLHVTTTHADAWAWDGSAWTPVAGYAAQTHGVAAYHARAGAPVLVGGVVATTSEHAMFPMPGGTWRWDGQYWRSLTANTPTDPLVSIADDPNSGDLIGLAAQNPFSPAPAPPGQPGRGIPDRRGYACIWTFHEQRWTLDVRRTPPEQVGGVLVADPTVDRLLLITALGHIWTLHRDQWAAIQPPRSLPATASAPTSRLHAVATHSGVLLAITSPTAPDQTWTFDGHTWHHHA